MRPFYVPRVNVETFVLNEIPAESAATTKGRVLEEKVLSERIRAGPGEARVLMVAYAAVLSGERSQRMAIVRKLTPKTRNIELGVDTVPIYLARTLAGKKKGKRTKKMHTDERKEDYLADALRAVRQELGVGDAQPSLYSYQITEDAVAQTENPELQRKLRELITHGDLDDYLFQQLTEFLEKRHPQEACPIIEAVRATRSREHISAISLQSNERGLFVTIVNAQGNRLTFLEHKFRDLLTHPNVPRLLHKYTWEDGKRKEADFVFTERTEGMVLAKLDTAACALDVVCMDEKERRYYDRARFVLDLDYACCLHIVLNRIREDRARYDRLLEQAEASVGIDPFPGGIFPQFL